MAIAEPIIRKWTRREYYHMADLGWFRGQRVELLEGDIVVLSPQKPLHYATTDQSTEVLRRHCGIRYSVRMQGPINLGQHSEPEPDIAVVRGSRKKYGKQHPRSALLVVEVSDTTLQSDRGRKASLYARAGIEDYWIINLVERRLEVFRNPGPDENAAYGFAYQERFVLTVSDEIAPLATPGKAIAIRDLLP